MSGNRWDIWMLMGFAVAAMAIPIVGATQSPWVSVFEVPLVLLVPGYALSLLLLPDLEGPDRLLCSLGLSCSVAVLGGIVLYLTPLGLRPVPWALWLGGITLLAGGAVLARNRRLPMSGAPSGWPVIQARPVIGFALALLVVGLSIATSRLGAVEADTPLTELWAVPQHQGQAHTIQVGLRNQEGERVTYHLSIENAGQSILDRPQIILGPGEERVEQLDLSGPPASPIFVYLYREKAPSELYRWVEVSPASFYGQ